MITRCGFHCIVSSLTKILTSRPVSVYGRDLLHNLDSIFLDLGYHFAIRKSSKLLIFFDVPQVEIHCFLVFKLSSMGWVGDGGASSPLPFPRHPSAFYYNFPIEDYGHLPKTQIGGRLRLREGKCVSCLIDKLNGNFYFLCLSLSFYYIHTLSLPLSRELMITHTNTIYLRVEVFVKKVTNFHFTTT